MDDLPGIRDPHRVPSTSTGATAGERYDVWVAWLDLHYGSLDAAAYVFGCSMRVISVMESLGVTTNDTLTDAQWDWIIRNAA